MIRKLYKRRRTITSFGKEKTPNSPLFVSVPPTSFARHGETPATMMQDLNSYLRARLAEKKGVLFSKRMVGERMKRTNKYKQKVEEYNRKVNEENKARNESTSKLNELKGA